MGNGVMICFVLVDFGISFGCARMIYIQFLSITFPISSVMGFRSFWLLARLAGVLALGQLQYRYELRELFHMFITCFQCWFICPLVGNINLYDLHCT